MDLWSTSSRLPLRIPVFFFSVNLFDFVSVAEGVEFCSMITSGFRFPSAEATPGFILLQFLFSFLLSSRGVTCCSKMVWIKALDCAKTKASLLLRLGCQLENRVSCPCKKAWRQLVLRAQRSVPLSLCDPFSREPLIWGFYHRLVSGFPMVPSLDLLYFSRDV